MNFAAPLILLLLPLPLILWFLAPPDRRPRPALIVPAHLFGGRDVPVAGADRIGLALAAFGWVALVAALAGPRIGTVSDILPASGRDIVLAIDLSGSMLTQDFRLDGEQVSRLDAVKHTAAAFVAARPGDRIGLVVFGDRAYFASPLTFDVDAVARAVTEAQVGISGRSTAISDGLGLAMKRLSRSDAPGRVIVLLSDGVDTTGSVPAVEAAGFGAAMGIRIHTIALGPADLETEPRNREAVDAATLRAVAEAGGGESFRVRTTEDLRAMAATLDRIEPNPTMRPPLRFWRELWVWPGAVAALCLMLIGWRGRA